MQWPCQAVNFLQAVAEAESVGCLNCRGGPCREKEGLLLHLAKDGVFPAAANAALETPPPLMMAQLAFAIFFVATTVGLGWLLALFQWARLYVLGSTLAVVVIAYLDI